MGIHWGDVSAKGGQERPPLALVAWGCVTPLGENALESALGFRAGASALGQCALVDALGEVPQFSTVALLDPLLQGDARLAPLMMASIHEALSSVAHLLSGRVLSVHFLADEPEPGLRPEHNLDALALMARDQVRQLTTSGARVQLHARGSAGLAEVLDQVETELRHGQAEAAVIVAAHTDYSREWVDFLSAHRRLHGADHLDGMTLSELAGTIVVCAPTMARALGLEPALHVDSWKHGVEKALWSNDEPAYEALTLTAIARKVTERHHQMGRKIGWVSSDASLETFRMAELQSLIIRLQPRLGPPQLLDTPAHRFGHLGAAAGLWQLIYAAEAYVRKFAPCPEKLCLLGTDQGGRAALVISAAR